MAKNNEPKNSEKVLLENGWISVETQLPDYGLPVLVCQANEEDTLDICRLESTTTRKDSISNEWLLGKNGYDNYWFEVTHWQHLPKYL